MKTTNWRMLLEEESEYILDALVEAYSDACGNPINEGFLQGVKIDREGNIAQYLISPDNLPSDVWIGKAIEIARIAKFNPLNNIEKLLPYMTEEEFQAFTRFLDGECPSLHKLRLWKPEIADRVEKEYLEKYLSETAYDWASKTLKGALVRFSGYDREESLKVKTAD